MHNYRDIKIWQKARTLVKDVYLVTKQFPTEELYGLTSQTRRAAVSVVLNIAEGAGRGTNKDFSHFLDMTKGSLFEVESLMFLACDLEYIFRKHKRRNAREDLRDCQNADRFSKEFILMSII